MQVVSLVTQKGGSGKSTMAACLAVAAHEAGENVFVIDMDPQASLTQWSKTRGENDIPVEAIPHGKLDRALTLLAKNGVSLVIIDTAGTESAATAAAMRAANLCIIPVRPAIFDIWASEATRKTLKSLRRDYVFLLNQCPAAQDSERMREGAKSLESLGGLLTPLVASRVDYQEAAKLGWGVTEYAPAGKAADEMRHLWKSLKRRLAKGKPAAKARKAA